MSWLPERNSYPWKLGATSFVIPATVEENVRFLAGRVDDIQLLFFESSWQARLPHVFDMGLLAQLAEEYDHSYTVHLPLDLHLGCADRGVRNQAVDEICQIAETCQVLQPRAYDLHLNREQRLDPAAWRDHCQESLLVLQDRLGSSWSKLCVENIGYEFGLVADVVRGCQAGVCADFGHLHHQQHSDENWLKTHDVRHVHLHGVRGGQDHQALGSADIPFLQRLGQEMLDHGYGEVVTLELYKDEWLAESLAILDLAWGDFNIAPTIK